MSELEQVVKNGLKDLDICLIIRDALTYQSRYWDDINRDRELKEVYRRALEQIGQIITKKT